MAFRFEELTIWQQARTFSRRIHERTVRFPRHEQYALGGQLNRASNAVSLLIAEGTGLKTQALFSHRLSLALGETFETASGLFLAMDRRYLTEEEHARLYVDAAAMSKSIAAFRRTLR